MMSSSLSVFIIKAVFITSVLHITNTIPQNDDYTDCGKRLKYEDKSDFIFKTEDTRNPPGSWPWVVSIGEKSSVDIWTHRCGGSLVKQEFVLTAAHCALDLSAQIRKGVIFIRAGDDLLKDAIDDANVEVVEVVDFEIHPNYNHGPRYFDVAVLKLAQPVSLSPTVRTVCLPTKVTARQDDDGNSLTVTGWGADDRDQSGKSLFHARVQVYPQASCDLTHSGERRSKEAVPWGFTSDLLCGGDPAQSEGICYGDSGSPAVFHRIAEKNYVLKAIVSGGISCGTEEHPNIYVRTSDESILPWIYDQINKKLLLNIKQSQMSLGGAYSGSGGWTKYVGQDCYQGRGGDPMQPDPYSTSITLSACQAVCQANSECEGVIRKASDGQGNGICYLRKNIKFANCPDGIWDFYYKTGGGGIGVLEDTTIPETRRSCDGADTCETRETCPYIREKYNEAHQATGGKQKEITKFLKSIICNKRRKAFCCPKSEYIYVVGGIKLQKHVNTDKVLNTVEVFNPTLNSWSEVPPMSTPRNIPAVEVFNNELYVVGGSNYQQGSLSTVEKWNPVTSLWHNVSSLNKRRRGAGAAVFAGNLFVLGGEDNALIDSSLASIEMYVNNQWQIVSFLPAPHEVPGVVELDGKLYIIGGYDEYSGDYNLVTMFDGEYWSHMNMNEGRQGPGVATLDGKIYAAGGSRGNFGGFESLSTVEMFDPVRNKWTNIANMNVERFKPALVSQGGKLWVFGGLDPGYLTSVEKYDPVKDEWTIVGDMKSCAGPVGAGVLRY